MKENGFLLLAPIIKQITQYTMKLSSKITTAVTALATFTRLPGAIGASINPSRIKGNIVPKNLPNTDDMAGFNVIYPENDNWAWEKADPKTSLFGIGLTNPAPQWLLNIVEATHWASFPIGFIIANYLFNHASELELGADRQIKCFS